jgi:hypothetical protein
MSEAMDRGREMHEAIDWDAWERHVARRQAEDRVHNPPKQPTVVWVDMENDDGKLRALLDDKKRLVNTIIVIPDNHADANNEELRALIEGRHPMQKRVPLYQIPMGDFIQEHDNLPPDTCRCEFDPYDDGNTEPSTHYKRTCLFCKQSWFGLHCPHDFHQRPCPNCGKKPITLK